MIVLRSLFLESFSQLFCDFQSHISIQTVRNNVIDWWGFSEAFCNCLGGINFHILCNLWQGVFQDSFENTWEHQWVVDLVLEVTSSTCIYKCATLFGLVWEYFWIWICQGKNYWFFVHFFYRFLFQYFAHWNSNEYVCSAYNIIKMAFFPC